MLERVCFDGFPRRRVKVIGILGRPVVEGEVPTSAGHSAVVEGEGYRSQ